MAYCPSKIGTVRPTHAPLNTVRKFRSSHKIRWQKLAKSSLTQLHIALKFDVLMQCEILKINFRSNPRWRTVTHFQPLNRYHSAVDRLLSLKLCMWVQYEPTEAVQWLNSTLRKIQAAGRGWDPHFSIFKSPWFSQELFDFAGIWYRVWSRRSRYTAHTANVQGQRVKGSQRNVRYQQ